MNLKLTYVSVATLVLLLLCLAQGSLLSDEEKSSVKLNVGKVILEVGLDEERVTRTNEHLHFCIFDNGKNDSIYVATRFGGWYMGRFELKHDSKVIATVNVPDLLNGGVMIPIGDVYDSKSHGEVGFGASRTYVSNVRGVFK